MIIRPATVEDLPRMEACAREFYASTKYLRGFNLENFCKIWTDLMAKGVGVIFGLFDDAGEVRGALGGVVSADLYSQEPYAVELFWFVSEGFRGKGMEMYRAFEAWARQRECVQVRMVHLMDSMPDKLAHVYKRLGFHAAELHYAKEIA